MTAQNHKKKILKKRANSLKQPLKKTEVSGNYINGLEFLLADENYAIDSMYVAEVIYINDLTPLPCTPDFVLGIINLRGKILSVIDIKKIFKLRSNGITNLNKVIVVKHNDIELGVLADEIIGNSVISIDNLQKKVTSITENNENFIIGLTKERLIVLDIKQLLSSDKIIIDQEVT